MTISLLTTSSSSQPIELVPVSELRRQTSCHLSPFLTYHYNLYVKKDDIYRSLRLACQHPVSFRIEPYSFSTSDQSRRPRGHWSARGGQDMYSVDHSQDIWPPDDAQAGSLVSSVSGHSRTELDTFTGEMVTGSEPLRSASINNGSQAPFKTPGILRTMDKSLARNGLPLLPPEKAFSIQIGWRLFRLSGASITSDGEYRLRQTLLIPNLWLISPEHPHTFRITSRNK